MIRLKYLGRTPKRIELPIPFLSRSEKCGEVLCDPIGEFTNADADSLLNLAPEMWERVTPEKKGVESPPASAEPPVKKLSNLDIWRAKQRLIKQQKKEQLQQREPSQPQAEGSHTPSP